MSNKSLNEEYQQLLQPSLQLINDIKQIEGDIIILGAGGKMGPALARLAVDACKAANVHKAVTAVSRFSDKEVESELNSHGVTTISADLLNDNDLATLPDVPNVLYLAGQKFGTTGKEAMTWAMNAYLPGQVAKRFQRSRIVAFSTGNVYPLSSIESGGAKETDLPGPIGEYAQSCLARERIFEYSSQKFHIPTFIYRLNYAVDVTYGVLVDIATSVKNSQPVDLRMGYVNVIWQGDANEIALRALLHCKVPAAIVNVTGQERLSVRWVAEEFGKHFERDVQFIHEEQSTALLSNASYSKTLFGEPRVSVKQMISLIARWLTEGGKTINKPTHFQEREGKF